MGFLDILLLILSTMFVGFIISEIIYITMEYFNINKESKYFLLIPTIIIAIILLFGCLSEKSRDNQIKDYIDSSNSINELQETLTEKEIIY